jgi:hypothetical protein
MPGLLTTASTMMCPHGGTVQASPSSTRAQVAGAPLVSATDLFTIVGCVFNISGAPHPCVSVQWVQPAARSTLAGNPTLTEASVGLCVAADQAPQGPVMIVAAQPNVSGQ